MKRINNLYNDIIAIDNLRLADEKARRGKRKSRGVLLHDQNRDNNIYALHLALKEKTFQTSSYSNFKIYEPKEREISRLPYYPDRIVHHAVMNKLESVWVSVFTIDTYSCIKDRGIHGALERLKKDLKDMEGTKYCLKIDIKKYYPSIDHSVLKSIIRRKIKDKDLLWLMDGIIDSAPGIPIGNYLSQYFANLYLAYFDHYVKEEMMVRYYYRYADDMVFLSGSKDFLHDLFSNIKEYLLNNLKLEIKDNYQIFPVESRGIDYIGYRFYHTHTLLRKLIKKRFARAVSKRGSAIQTHAAYWGWAKHCNSINLVKKLNMKSFSDFNIPVPTGSFTGEKIKIAKIMNREIIVHDSRIDDSKFPKNKSGKVLVLQIEVDSEKRVLFTGSDILIGQIQHVQKEDYPFTVTIVKEGEHFQFR